MNDTSPVPESHLGLLSFEKNVLDHQVLSFKDKSEVLGDHLHKSAFTQYSLHFTLPIKQKRREASLPLLASLLTGLGWSAGWRGWAPPLLSRRVGLALLAIGCTGRLIRQTPSSTGSEGWRMRERAAEWEDGTVAHTRRGSSGRTTVGGVGWGGDAVEVEETIRVPVYCPLQTDTLSHWPSFQDLRNFSSAADKLLFVQLSLFDSFFSPFQI